MDPRRWTRTGVVSLPSRRPATARRGQAGGHATNDSQVRESRSVVSCVRCIAGTHRRAERRDDERLASERSNRARARLRVRWPTVTRAPVFPITRGARYLGCSRRRRADILEAGSEKGTRTTRIRPACESAVAARLTSPRVASPNGGKAVHPGSSREIDPRHSAGRQASGQAGANSRVTPVSIES